MARITHFQVVPYKNIGTSSRNATLGIAWAASNDATTTYLWNDYFSTRWYRPQVMRIFVVTCALTRVLHAPANMAHVLDGDNVKHVRYCDPTFKPEDRAQNIRIVPYKNIGTSSRNATLGIAWAASNDATTTYLRNDYFSTRWYRPQVMRIFVVTRALTRVLHAPANMAHVLDGDNVKHVRYCDPTFKPEDRAQNIRIGAVMLYNFIIIPLTF
ncbi:APS kinase [Artemisia annua]|uniref:APS kinase n=1 Tax=Artemisia annua TaxID=35608 RepID=A0A2U1PLC0_ARTAN|nr:APS kinase [Artemisia annua]